MFIHNKPLLIELHSLPCDPAAAKYLLPLIEHTLSMASGLLFMRHTMPFDCQAALITQWSLSALNQFELLCTAFGALLRHACPRQMECSGLWEHYARHTGA